MKIKNSILTIVFAIGIILFWGACTSSNKSGENESEEHSHDDGDMDHDDGEAMDMTMDGDHDDDQHEHDDAAMSSMDGAELAWSFSEGDGDIFSKSFHFVMGSADDLDASASGGSVTLNPNGNPATFVFHNKIGNVGGEVYYMLHGFKGNIKLVHHFKDEQNYEYVSINGNQMKLGRIINGNNEIFDEKAFEAESSGWTQLRVSAAGSHFKGYIGGETITHGHGDALDDGYVGLMINGTGSIMLKDFMATVLEDE